MRKEHCISATLVTLYKVSHRFLLNVKSSIVNVLAKANLDIDILCKEIVL